MFRHSSPHAALRGTLSGGRGTREEQVSTFANRLEVVRGEGTRSRRHMQPSLEEIKKLRSQGNVIPVYKSVIADFLTPVSAFLKLEKGRSHAFLLESVEGGERMARYSFLGVDPFLITRYRNGQPANFMQNLRG